MATLYPASCGPCSRGHRSTRDQNLVDWRRGAEAPRMKLFGTKSGRPVVPWRMLRLPEVPRRVRIAAWCAAALFAAAAAGIGIIAVGCPPLSAPRGFKTPPARPGFDRDNQTLARARPPKAP